MMTTNSGFVAGTLVITGLNNQVAPIESLKPGDVVLSPCGAFVHVHVAYEHMGPTYIVRPLDYDYVSVQASVAQRYEFYRVQDQQYTQRLFLGMSLEEFRNKSARWPNYYRFHRGLDNQNDPPHYAADIRPADGCRVYSFSIEGKTDRFMLADGSVCIT